MKKFLRFLFKTLNWLIIGLILVPGLIWLTFKIVYNPKIYTIDDVPEKRVALVFGAGLRRDGTPTAVLRDRVQTAVDLYNKGKVEKLLLSGDNRYIDYNEPGSMRAYALSLGVPAEDIVLDYAGRRTYDTCYRAKHIFQTDEVILVTQNFHLPRSLFLCSQIGLDAVGVNADQRSYSAASFTIWNIREVLATLSAIVDVWLRHPTPVLGPPEPIF